jgi:uncharacterized protein (TIGR03067 family)
MFCNVIGRVVVILAVLLLGTTVRGDEAPEPSAKKVKVAVEKALPLLIKGADGHLAEKTCFSCHNQTLPLLALTTAKERGFSTPDADPNKHTKGIAEFLDENRENYLKGKGQGGKVDLAGNALFTLELGGWKPDATTEAVVEYMLQHDKDLDHWRSAGSRPPAGSDFAPTYLALRALGKWGTPGQKERIARRVEVVRDWVVKTPARDTEDRVFRLWALRAAGSDEKEIRAARQDLVRSQRVDGGWGQTDTMDSDAYATGSALVALHQAGELPPTDRVYQRGCAFLLKTQKEDGSWMVRTRSRPIQPYYESGFPYGKDQFISIAATGWATTALALTASVSVRDEAVKKELQSLKGTWRLIGWEVDGKKIGEAECKDITLTVDGTGRFSVRCGDLVVEAAIKLDPTMKPAAVDVTFSKGKNREKTTLGIYEIDGDIVRVCHARSGDERPTEFSAGSGSGRTLVTYKREKK